MSLQDRLAAVLGRIAPATSVLRVRDREAEMSTFMADDSRAERLEAAITRLETVADELEKAIA